MLVVYSEHITPRLRYVCSHIFSQVYHADFELVDDAEVALQSEFLVCYSEKRLKPDAFHICPSGLLSETGVRVFDVEVSYINNMPVIMNYGGDLSFDVFSAVFFLLSRYEEYFPAKHDKHGRYVEQESFLFKTNLLDVPVADLWIKKFAEMLIVRFPSLKITSPVFQHIKTIDVDNVFAYRHRGVLVNGLRLFQDFIRGNTDSLDCRLKSVFRIKKDPYFNLDDVAEIHNGFEDSTVFFFHCGGYGKFDKKTIVPSLSYRNVRKRLAENFLVGLHPSYRSASCHRLFSIEKKICSWVTKKDIYRNRFHYLRFRLPDGYRMLEEKGVTEDYSMAYSNTPGFRAGTSFPFFFYDIFREKTTELKIYPLMVMDKTLRSNLGLSVVEAKDVILKLAQTVHSVGGCFVTLFHNENMVDDAQFGWSGWKQMYSDVIHEINERYCSKR